MSVHDAIASALADLNWGRGTGRGLWIAAHRPHPSDAPVRVLVQGRMARFVVSDGGGAVDQVESAGIAFGEAVERLQPLAGRQGLLLPNGAIRSPRVPVDGPGAAIVRVADASEEAAPRGMTHLRPAATGSFKDGVDRVVAAFRNADLHRSERATGASNKQHPFEYALRPGGGRPILLEAVHDGHASTSATAEDRRRYAPALQEMVRQGMIVRLAATIDAIDPPTRVGRPRPWSTLVMLQALWHVARDDRAGRRPPSGAPPRQTLWSRLAGGRRRAVPDRVLTIPVARRRRAAGRKPRPSAAIVDTRSVRTGPQRGPRGLDADKKVPAGPPRRAGSAARTGSTALRSMGRERVPTIGTQGDPPGVRVVSADVRDRDALRALAPDRAAHASLPPAWLDRGFAGAGPAAFLQAHGVATGLVRRGRPPKLPRRAPALEGRADLRPPATLPPPSSTTG